MTLHIDTPLLESQPLSRHLGRRVLLKMDALQPPGSFKIRGIGYAAEEHAKRGKRRFVSSSGGNAGIAVAYAGRALSILSRSYPRRKQANPDVEREFLNELKSDLHKTCPQLM